MPQTGNHADKVEEHIKKSLESLQLDYVDLYLIHFPVWCKFDATSGKVEGLTTDHISLWKVSGIKLNHLASRII